MSVGFFFWGGGCLFVFSVMYFWGGRDRKDLAVEKRRYQEVFVVRPKMGGKHILEDKWKWEIYKEDWSGWRGDRRMKRENRMEDLAASRPAAKLCLSTSASIWEKESAERRF